MGVDPNQKDNKQAIKILMDCILVTSYDRLHAEVKRYAQGGNIMSTHLKKALTDVANLSDHDAHKVTLGAQQLHFSQFENLLQQALLDAKTKNSAVGKFNDLIRKRTQTFVQCCVEKDINKDGSLSFEGFKSAVLRLGDIDTAIPLYELKQIFSLISVAEEFHY